MITGRAAGRPAEVENGPAFMIGRDFVKVVRT